jgi:hypothetical protein
MKGLSVDPLFSHPIQDEPATSSDDDQPRTPVGIPEFSHRHPS